MAKRPEGDKVQLGDMSNFVIAQVNTFNLHSILIYVYKFKKLSINKKINHNHDWN